MTTTLEQPPAAIEPGVYDGLSMAVYQSWPFASSHRLHALKRSPLHCKFEMDSPDEPTPALIMGSLVNTMLLEPELVDQQFAVAGQCVVTTLKGARCSRMGGSLFDGEWYCTQHLPPETPTDGGKRVVSREQFETAGACVLAIRNHPAARKLLDDRTDTELSLVWRDEETGVLCKARPDALIRPDVLLDLKTCRDASRRAFERAIFDYGYHTQAALYRMGLKAHGIDIRDAALICCETEAPHCVSVFQFLDDILDRGTREVRRLLRVWAKCMESGEWPGYGDGVNLIGLPKWATEDETL